jgi:biopolymer transport protein ExbD
MASQIRQRIQAKRRKKVATGINLVSLMDIFTILVFFLLVNSSDVEILPGKASVTLPESVSEVKPHKNIVIIVDNENILVQGQKIATVADVLASNGQIIAELQKELGYQFTKSFGDKPAKGVTGSVTIMGDKSIPYRLLKRIMITCSESNFGNISLAVQQRARGQG